MMRITPDATTSTLNGLVAQNDGDVRIIENIGTGILVLANEALASAAANRFATPGAFNVSLDAGGVAQCIYDATTTRWRVIATDGLYNQQLGTNGFLNFGAGAQRGGIFYTNATQTMGFYNPTTRLQFNLNVVTMGLGLMMTAAIAPAQITGTVNNYAPASFAGAYTVRQDVGIGGVLLTGLAGGASGRQVLLLNIATDPRWTLTLAHQDTGSLAANRFVLPNAQPYTIPAGGGALLSYDTAGNWVVTAAVGNVLETSPQYITPAVLAAGDTDNYEPTDAISGQSGRYAVVWRIQGNAGASVLTGVNATPAGTPAFANGSRILLMNYGTLMTLTHQAAGSAAANRFNLPGAATLTLRQFGSIELIYDGTNLVWYTANVP
jgi:hypothetical protein